MFEDLKIWGVTLFISWWMIILGIVPSKELCSQNLAMNCKFPLWVVISCTWMYCQGGEGAEHHWPWKKMWKIEEMLGSMKWKYLCDVLLGRPWALKYLLFLVLYAASRVLTTVLSHMNKNCYIFSFRRFAGSVFKWLLWNVVWGLILE